MKRRSTHYVIIGNSAAGISAARQIRRHDRKGRITVLSDESTFGYSRVMLPLYIARKIRKKDMLIAPKSYYASLGIGLRRGQRVEGVDPKTGRVHIQNGKTLAYDRLLVATGSSARRLDVPGEDLSGVHHLRQMADAEVIRKDLASVSGPVVVIGGGLVGVKSLEALIARKREVHLVISSDRILSQMLDREASDLFLRSFERKGIGVHLQTDVRGFEGRERLRGALLSDGTFLASAVAIIGKGVDPNIGCVAGTGVQINQGIVVDPHMATSLSGVYAAGDVVEPFDVIERKHRGNAIWPLAVEGGRVAGSNMVDGVAVFSGAVRMNSVEVLGTRVISAGQRHGDHEMIAFRKGGAVYCKLVFSEGRFSGFILAGDIGGAGVLTSLLRSQTDVAPAALEDGLARGFSFWPRFHTLGGRIEGLTQGTSYSH
jgi:nitrite reductase (NADH) large subunit